MNKSNTALTTPLKKYQADVESERIKKDKAQEKAIKLLQQLHQQLSEKKSKSRFRFWQKNTMLEGVYMWGPVGTGKTYLMDTFYHCLTKRKLRQHFHEFMQGIHSELKALKEIKNPLEKVASQLAEKYDVICFDEFFVSNIVDAMLLGNLLKSLFNKGICLVATSNVVPDRLYEDGLQREQFMPAIKLINAHMNIIEVDNKKDYRLRKLTHADTYFYPINDQTKVYMQKQFDQFAKGDVEVNGSLTILKRKVHFLKKSYNAIWFDFNVICKPPRSQYDYLELVKQFDYIFISGIRHFHSSDNDAAVLFISLIDVVYNAHKEVFLLANYPLSHLYESGQMSFEFKRTHSRLVEMQSEEYLNRC